MKIKNLNPIELHIEKAVLALAVLGAGYLAYTCLTSPTTVEVSTGPGQTVQVAPKDAEMQVRAQIEQLERKGEFTNQQIAEKPPKLYPEPVGYAREYDVAMATPLPARVVQGMVPVFGPPQVAAGKSAPTTNVAETTFASLEVPKFKKPVTADTYLGVVGTLVQGKLLNPRDARVVRVAAQFPMGELRDKVDKYPPNFRVALVARAEWQRQEMGADGKWSDWKPLQPLKGSPGAAPPAVGGRPFTAEEGMKILAEAKPGTKANEAAYWLKWFMSYMGQTLQPALPAGQFDRDAGVPVFAPIGAAAAPATPAMPTRPAVPGIPVPGVPAPVVATAPAAPPRGPAPEVYGGTVGEGDAAANANNPSGGATVINQGDGDPGHINGPGMLEWSMMTTKENLDIWQYDDNVEPGHQYRYQVQLTIYNPLYKWPPQNKNLLKNWDTDSKVPFLTTGWATASVPVRTDMTDFFFITTLGTGMGNKPVLKIELYRYLLGTWRKATHNEVAIGAQVGVTNAQSPVMPHGDLHPVMGDQYSVGYTVVDIIPTGPNDGTVVLMDPMGQLVTRTVSVDAASPQRKDLDVKIPAKGPAGATAGTPAAGTGG